MPKWAQATLQAQNDVVGDLVDQRRTWSQFDYPPHSLTTNKTMIPMYCYKFLASYIQTYAEATENPFWEATM
jgi:hypothetical protein